MTIEKVETGQDEPQPGKELETNLKYLRSLLGNAQYRRIPNEKANINICNYSYYALENNAHISGSRRVVVILFPAGQIDRIVYNINLDGAQTCLSITTDIPMLHISPIGSEVKLTAIRNRGGDYTYYVPNEEEFVADLANFVHKAQGNKMTVEKVETVENNPGFGLDPKTKEYLRAFAKNDKWW